jgi:hypothetical protein
MKSFSAQLVSGLLLAAATLGLGACSAPVYYYPQYNYAGRPTPPSGLLQRVLASYTANGSSGGLEILDGLRDIRSNVANTIPRYAISGYSGGNPTTIFNYPEQTTGYVFSSSDGSLAQISYSKESSVGSVGSFGSNSPSVATTATAVALAGAGEQSGTIAVSYNGGSQTLNLPNVYRVAISPGGNTILAMTRNTNLLYRIVKLPASNNPVIPPGSVDCEPLLLPVFCVVPVAGTYDRPQAAYFSLDGSAAYILNCGPECGGTQASVSFLQESALDINNIPTVNPLSVGAPSPMLTLPVANPVPVPGGVTTALSDGTTLYLAGQSLFSLTGTGALGTTPRADNLYTGYLSRLNLATYAVSNPISIPDGTHTKLLFADDNTLWVGSSQCASGERAATGQNVNCLAMIKLGGTSLTAMTIPANVVPGGSVTVPYPNTNQNAYYYGSLTGICWVQGYHKVYTAYGGQIHAFNTTDGSEINNYYITIQGTVLDVAYMDALTNQAN